MLFLQIIAIAIIQSPCTQANENESWQSAKIQIREATTSSEHKLDLLIEGAAAKSLYSKIDSEAFRHRGGLMKTAPDQSVICSFDPAIGTSSYWCNLFLIRK